MADDAHGVTVSEKAAKQLLREVEEGRKRTRIWQPPKVVPCGFQIYYRFKNGRLVIDDIRCEGACSGKGKCRWAVVHSKDDDSGTVSCGCVSEASGTGGGAKPK